MQRFAVLCCVVALLGAAGLFSVHRSAAMAATHTVAIDGVTFVPATLVIKAGDTVVWVNKDPFPHTVASQTGGFESPAIESGQSWRYTPTKPGVFPYLCTLHPTMHATLRVE
jgi:plastocyanin